MSVLRIDKKIIEILKNNGVGVLPTDTLYGLVGSAMSKKAVERIYRLKKRDPKKPFIILIADFKDLEMFDIKVRPGSDIGQTLKKFWPGRVSIILPLGGQSRVRDISDPIKFGYLHRGKKSLAFRTPKPKWLRGLLRKTGPLTAPSANPEALPTAETIEQAKEYFEDRVDFYVETGRLKGKPSTLVEIKNGRVIILRQGAVKVTT